jgi:hypothetical protein
MSIEKHMGKMDLDTLKANVEKAADEAQDAESEARAAAAKAAEAKRQSSTAKDAASQKDQIAKGKGATLVEAKKKAKKAADSVKQKIRAKALKKVIASSQTTATKLANDVKTADAEAKLALKEKVEAEASATAAEADTVRLEKAADVAAQTEKAAQRALAAAERALELASSPCVRFFDATTLKTVEPRNTTVKVSWQGENKKETEDAQISKWQDQLALELPPDLKYLLRRETVLVTILSQVYDVECGSYVTADVSFLAASESESCCCVPIAMLPLEQACTLKVRTYDSSKIDRLEDAKSFLDDVEVRVTAMKTPVAVPDAPSRLRPITRSARTVDGELEFTDLPTEQLYQVEVRPPEGYLCETPAIQQLYICGNGSVDLVARLRPCGQDPVRSAVFVRKECPGVRWSHSCVKVAGQVQRTDADGMVDLSGLTGVVELKYPGMSFSPAHINLGKAGAPMSVIEVADQPASRYPQPPRREEDDNFFVLDFEKLPPASTEVEVTSLTGEHIAYLTADTSGMYRYPAPGEYDFVVRVGGREVDRARLKAGRD